MENVTRKIKHPEYELQVAVSRYLSYQYPEVLFASDTIANLKLSKAQAGRNKKIQKNDFKMPDMVIFEARNGFNGLFIELKIKSPFKKNGEILKNEHLEGQLKTIEQLNLKGYKACFSVGFDETKKIIDEYLT